MNFAAIPKNFVPEPFAYHEELELDIRTLTNEGRGIGQINGWTVMVPFVIPGEHVRVRIFRNHKNYSEADLMEVITPSLQRITPKCPLFGKCGGCQYQHMSYEEQLKWKRQQIVDCYERIGKLHTEIKSLIPSAEVYGYRTKLTPHFERHGDKCPVGFLMNGSRRNVVDVLRCPIASSAINESLLKVRKGIPVSQRHGTLLLREDDKGVTTDFNAICSSTVHGLTFKFPAGSFFQNNPYILNSIFEFLESFIEKHSQIKSLIDAYCGVGVFGIALAKHVERFIGIEIDEKSIQLAGDNMKENNIHNGTFVAGDAQSLFKDITCFDPDTALLIMDPPRKGADELFLKQLVHYAPKYIAYISCAPDTQARDLNRLCALSQAYKLIQVQPFDMFPQTKHMECIAILERS